MKKKKTRMIWGVMFLAVLAVAGIAISISKIAIDNGICRFSFKRF